MNLSLPMLPVHLVDMAGSMASLAVGVGCYALSRELSQKDETNPLSTYLYWISVAFVIFTVSRSLGHLVKYFFTFSGHEAWWEHVSPVSGAVNSATFVVVATLTFYYERIHENYKALREEKERIKESERRLELSHQEISGLIDAVRDGHDLSVRFKNSHLLACWNVRDCVEEGCPAHRSGNLRCWHLKEKACCSVNSADQVTETPCRECDVYQLGRHDPLQRLGERFNDMMNILETRTLALEDANRKLTALDIQKSKFLEIVAHDLRTPLTSILSYADLLLRYKDEAEETKEEFLRTIVHESRRLGDLINDYLDLSKIESGLMEFRQERLDFREVIDHAVNLYGGAAMQKGIEIRAPSESDPLWITGDKNRLVQVMSNLLSNAVKFTPDFGYVDVQASLTDHDAVLQVAVRDTGPGVPEGDLENVFSKFVQVHDGKTHAIGGTGLGLPICREIMSHHGGRIWAENRKEGGASFHCLLPVAHRRVAAGITDQRLESG